MKKKELVSEEEVGELREQYGEDAFEVGIGAEAVRKLLEEIDLIKLDETLRSELKLTLSDTKRKKFVKLYVIISCGRLKEL